MSGQSIRPMLACLLASLPYSDFELSNLLTSNLNAGWRRSALLLLYCINNHNSIDDSIPSCNTSGSERIGWACQMRQKLKNLWRADFTPLPPKFSLRNIIVLLGLKIQNTKAQAVRFIDSGYDTGTGVRWFVLSHHSIHALRIIYLYVYGT